MKKKTTEKEIAKRGKKNRLPAGREAGKWGGVRVGEM